MELILSLCMVAMPDVCFEHEVATQARGASEYLCTDGAPEIVADWAEQHPKVKVIKWRCAPPTREI